MYETPSQVFTNDNVKVLKKSTGIDCIDTLTAIFFLLSKSEHDNEKWEKTFLGEDGKSVFFYAKRLPYDGEQRGCTVGLAGWTTANGGKDKNGDFHDLAVRYKRMGGIDLRKLCKGLTKNKDKAKEFCDKIRNLHGEHADLFVTAQFKQLCRPGGYIHDSVEAIEDAGIKKPSALLIAAVVDTAINQGFGGKWCPRAWLKEHADDDEKKLLKAFLKWKRVAATKNHHNDPPSNGEERSDMFKNLLDAGALDLDRAECEKAVKWRMR
jgi:hypothetical protein